MEESHSPTGEERKMLKRKNNFLRAYAWLATWNGAVAGRKEECG